MKIKNLFSRISGELLILKITNSRSTILNTSASEPKKPTKWLKKYTKLEYLEDILNQRQLHLASPDSWPDKNDSEAFNIYASTKNINNIKCLCLTGSPDRYHFWHIFGEQEKGVCLWFCRKSLEADIERDKSLTKGDVTYLIPENANSLSIDEIPFAKRKQYCDEREYRIIRVSKSETAPDDKFRFSIASLKRIYLNPWLSTFCVNREKAHISKIFGTSKIHIKIRQNKSLESRKWITALNLASKGSEN